MKKNYTKPSVKVAPIQPAQLVCTSPAMSIFRGGFEPSQTDQISQW